MTASSSAFGVDSVRLHIMLMGTCRQCGSWSVAGHNHRKVTRPARPHLCRLAGHGPWPVQKRFIRDTVWRRRLKPGYQIVVSVTIVDHRSRRPVLSQLHNCVDRCHVWPDHIGCRDASRGGGCSKTSAYTDQFGRASMIWSTSWQVIS